MMMMYAHLVVVLSLLVIGSRAAPGRRDDSDDSGLSLTIPGVPATIDLDSPDAGSILSALPSKAISVIQANSAAIVSSVGLQEYMSAEAFWVGAEAAIVAPGPPFTTQTQLTIITPIVSGTPVVVVSSIGGPAITVATGTAGPAVVTTFAGHVFTAAVPNRASTELQIPRGLVAGALTVVSCVLAGAMAIF
ncbi:hypothetical protein C8Q73DRAFT_301853 [Cubamyces lactineus]|nr:hypothetical protein C8Q73DRAFT_301853 [Cubamyces lactineus]